MPYAKGYYDRIDAAIGEMTAGEDIFTMPLLREVGRKYCLCPFELSLDLSLGCDVILCGL